MAPGAVPARVMVDSVLMTDDTEVSSPGDLAPFESGEESVLLMAIGAASRLVDRSVVNAFGRSLVTTETGSSDAVMPFVTAGTVGLDRSAC